MIHYISLNEERFFNKNIRKKMARSINISADRGSTYNPGKGRNFDKDPYFKYFNKINPTIESDPHYRISLISPKLVEHYEGKQNWKIDNDEGNILMKILNSPYYKNESKTTWQAMREYTIMNFGIDPSLISETPIDYTNIFKMI